MARTWNAGNAVRAATFRKWYARAWWIGLHVYGYVVLGYKGALSPDALSMPQFVSSLVVAVVTISCYVVLQCSSPGFIKKRTSVSPAIGQSTMPMTVNSPSPIPAAEDGVKTELLVEGSEHDLSGDSSDLHFCNDCHVFQPLRTKHCKDCDRCTRQYDHHCDCVGTCVGESNRRLFVLYLLLQSVEGAVMIGVTTSAISEAEDIDDWFKINALYLVLCFMIVCVLLMVVPLLGYQAFLISTNQTSWEHARRSSITYLQNLSDDRSPFDRGILQNWWVFLSNGDSNKWVHESVPNPITSYDDDASSLV
uniref:Palmitoyltransferase n=1 Tax=Peronospora matthiolae TaxID=2874970 RepID=A0AAV1TYH5_9STRA